MKTRTYANGLRENVPRLTTRLTAWLLLVAFPLTQNACSFGNSSRTFPSPSVSLLGTRSQQFHRAPASEKQNANPVSLEKTADAMVSSTVPQRPALQIPPEIAASFKLFNETLLGKQDSGGSATVANAKGLIQRVGDSQLEAEKKEKSQLKITGHDPEIQKAFARAAEIKKEVQEKLLDPVLDGNTRFSILKAHLQNVVFPMRALITVLDKDLPKEWATDFGEGYFKSLLPQVPKDLLSRGDPNGSDHDLGSPNSKTGELREAFLHALGFRVGEQEKNRSGDIAHVDPVCRAETVDLGVEPQMWLARDISALSGAVTAKNYARGLKLTTLAMILGQIEHHSQTLGHPGPIWIPQACRDAMGPGTPQKISVTPISEEEREARLEGLMQNNGLSSLSPEFRDYFENQVASDPTQPGLVGHTPFEKIRLAERAIKFHSDQNRDIPQNPAPVFDEADGARFVIAFKGSQGIGKMVEKLPKAPTRRGGPPAGPSALALTYIHKAQETLTPTDDPRFLAPTATYLISLMDQKKATDWKDVVPESVRRKLEANAVRIPMAPPESPDSWRRHSLSVLARTNASLIQKLSPIFKKTVGGRTQAEFDLISRVIKACHGTNPTWGRDFECPKSMGGPNVLGYLRKVQSQLVAFSYSDRYTPPTEYMTPEFRRMYLDYFMPLYESLSGAPTRYSPDGRPPAIEKNDLTNMRTNSLIPEAVKSEWDFLSEQMQTNPLASVRLSLLLERDRIQNLALKPRPPGRGAPPQDLVLKIQAESALQVLTQELNLETPLQPFHANRTLSSKEQKTAWSQTKEEHDSGNFHLFSQRYLGSDKPSYYDRIEKVADKTLLTKDEAIQACQQSTFGKAAHEYPKLVDRVLASDAGEKATLLHELYRARGDTQKQDSLLSRLEQEHGLSSEDGGREARKTFLDLDTALKRPLLKDIITKAIVQKKGDLTSQLTEFCSLNPEDHSKFKQIVLSTFHSQDKLNQMLGLKKLPDSVQSELTRLSKEDWKEIKLSLVSMALFIGGTLLLTASTGGLGLTMTPALASASAALAGSMTVGSVALSGGIIPKMWIEELPNAEAQASFVQAFQDLGLTNQESTDEMASRVSTIKTWGIGFNLAMVPQMVRPVATFTQTSARTLNAMSKSPAKTAVAAAAQRAQLESEVLMGQYVFGYRKVFSRNIVKQLRDDLKGAVELAVTDPGQIKFDSAKLFAKELGGDKANLQHFLKNYSKRLEFYAKRDPKEVVWGLKGFFARRGDWKKQVDALALELEKSSLDDFLLKHNDEFADLVAELPRRKRDLVRMVTVEGTPGFEGLVGNLKLISSSRKSMLKWLGTQEATAQLGADALKPAHLSHELFRDFSTALGPQAAQTLRREVTDQIRTDARIAPLRQKFGEQELERLLFDPANDRDAAVGSALWNSLPRDLIYDRPAVKTAAQKLSETRANYQTTAEFDEWLMAQKILRQAATAPPRAQPPGP